MAIFLHHIFSFRHKLHVLNMKLNILLKALPYKLWVSLPNKEIWNILRVLKRYVTLTLFWKWRLFTPLFTPAGFSRTYYRQNLKNAVHYESCGPRDCGIFLPNKRILRYSEEIRIFLSLTISMPAFSLCFVRI